MINYEPYRTPQSLALSAPNGLPGIKVDKDGNYTDKNGQQWICDEIDLARGKYVQRIEKHVFGDKDTFEIDTTINEKLNRFSWTEYQTEAKITTPIMCDSISNFQALI